MDANGTQFTGGQPQMRARMLQQIMEMGFRVSCPIMSNYQINIYKMPITR